MSLKSLLLGSAAALAAVSCALAAPVLAPANGGASPCMVVAGYPDSNAVRSSDEIGVITADPFELASDRIGYNKDIAPFDLASNETGVIEREGDGGMKKPNLLGKTKTKI